MKHITPYHMIGFNDQLRKEAVSAASIGSSLKSGYKYLQGNPKLRKALGYGAAASANPYGRQIAIGAGLGAVGGAAVGEEGDRASSALKGAVGLGGLAATRVALSREGRKSLKGATSRFLQRQRYSLTGKGLGETPAAQLSKAHDIKLLSKPEALAYGASKGAKKSHSKAMKFATEQEKAFKKGYLSAPGLVQGLLSKKGPGGVKTGPADVLKSGWRRGGVMGKGFAGLGAYEAGKGVLEKPEEGGPGRLEKGMRGAGTALGWMVAPHTIAGGSLIGAAGGGVGGTAGKVGDYVTGAAQKKFGNKPSSFYPQQYRGGS